MKKWSILSIPFLIIHCLMKNQVLSIRNLLHLEAGLPSVMELINLDKSTKTCLSTCLCRSCVERCVDRTTAQFEPRFAYNILVSIVSLIDLAC